ncbi:MAG: hypothetical protein MUC34_00065 [Anaerolineae bacterium]|jgi:TPR repeat protein|nr:hypothetical protein [Anaerolineae bacterium]
MKLQACVINQYQSVHLKRQLHAVMRAARCGDPHAQLTLGHYYLDGNAGLPIDPRAACLWLSRAAAQGSDDAAWLIATRVPAAGVIDPGSALPYFEAAASRGNAHAKKVLADWCLSGAAGLADPSRALALLLELADAGDTGAQLRLGLVLLANASDDITPTDAIRWLERAAHAGSVAAQRFLGRYLFERGEDQERAAHWLLLLANAGDAEMGTLLGIVLLRQERRREAAHWLARSAQRGDSLAQLWLGRAFLASQGRRASGLPRSYKQAARWLARAAAQGNGDACLELSRLYLRRSFSGRDPSMARRYLERAAMLDSIDAQYELGRACLRRGAASDGDVRGTSWLVRATAAGSLAAARLLEESGLTTPPAIEETRAQRRALTRALAVTDLPLSCRLEIAYEFALTLPEALLLDPVAADRGECLLITRHPGVRVVSRRVRAVHTREQREALDRSKRLIRPDPLSAACPHRALAQRVDMLLQYCRQLSLDIALLPLGSSPTDQRTAPHNRTARRQGSPQTPESSRSGRTGPARTQL